MFTASDEQVVLDQVEKPSVSAMKLTSASICVTFKS
jgi:hypothetical protein